MKRREAYATSGPRIELRVFGGFELPTDLCTAPDRIARGYGNGVPMGGVIAGDGQPRAPRIGVMAMRDPGTSSSPGGLLQRIQIVKGWLDGEKIAYEVYDAAGGPNDAAVDPATCTPRGAGADTLCEGWTDPNFDPTQPAFYYARVLENPSCRWHARACIAAGVACDKPASIKSGFEGCCRGEPIAQQERAWSSPIYYQPR